MALGREELLGVLAEGSHLWLWPPEACRWLPQARLGGGLALWFHRFRLTRPGWRTDEFVSCCPGALPITPWPPLRGAASRGAQLQTRPCLSQLLWRFRSRPKDRASLAQSSLRLLPGSTLQRRCFHNSPGVACGHSFPAPGHGGKPQLPVGMGQWRTEDGGGACPTRRLGVSGGALASTQAGREWAGLRVGLFPSFC